jgi:hypothetical protein
LILIHLDAVVVFLTGFDSVLQKKNARHKQQAAAGDEERQVHARLQDHPQDAQELQGYESHLHSYSDCLCWFDPLWWMVG